MELGDAAAAVYPRTSERLLNNAFITLQTLQGFSNGVMLFTGDGNKYHQFIWGTSYFFVASDHIFFVIPDIVCFPYLFFFYPFPIYLSADRCEVPFIEANGCEKKRYLQLFMTIQLTNSTEFCVNEMLKLFHLTTVLDCCDNWPIVDRSESEISEKISPPGSPAVG